MMSLKIRYKTEIKIKIKMKNEEQLFSLIIFFYKSKIPFGFSKVYLVL